MIGSKRLKIVVCVIAVLCCAVYLTGCTAGTVVATNPIITSPVLGAIYTDVKAPLAVGSPGSGADLLKGEATAVSVLGLIASGDASIRAAALAGGITEVHYVDYHSENFLGIYAKFTVYVYGKRVNDTSDLKSLDLSLPPTDAKSQAPPPAPTVDELLLKTLSPNPSYPTFDMNLEFQTDLDNQKFTEGLRAAFLNHGRILAPNAYIFVRKKEDGDWLIFDSRHEQVFLVKKGGGKLTVITQTYVSSSR